MHSFKKIPVYSLVLAVLLLGGCSIFSPSDKVATLDSQLKAPNIKVAVKWRFNSGADLVNSVLFKPVVINNEVIIASSTGDIYILDVNNGKLLKTIDLKQKLISGVGVDEQEDMFVVTNDYKLLAINKQNGAIIWHIKLNNMLLQAPKVIGDKVILYMANNVVAAYSTSTGESAWVYPAGVSNSFDLSLHDFNVISDVGDNTISLGLSDGVLSLLNADNGTLIWKSSNKLTITGSLPIDQLVNILGPVAVDGGTMCFSNYLHSLSCINKADGTVLWSKKQLAYSNVLLRNNKAYIFQEDGVILAFDQASGLVSWTNSILKGHSFNSFSFINRYIIIQDEDNYISLFNADNGELLTHQQLELKGPSELYSFGSNVLLLGNIYGSLIRLNINN